MMAATDRLQLLPQPALEGGIMERIILPAVAAMECWGRSFKGALCADLILLEFNVRLGDPEEQVLIMRLTSDLLPAWIRRPRARFEIDRSALACRACGLRRDGGQGHSGEPQRGTEISDLTAALEGCLAFLW
jgi:phosphoribosylamine---glycine ligase